MKNVKYADKNHSILFYYVALALKSTAIAMPHAFLTLIFLDKGISYSQIAIIQAFYSLGVVIFEYPSGVLADRYPRKRIYLVSIVLLAISYLLILNTNSYFLLVASWFIYGISTAMETGTIDSDMIIWIKENSDEDKISANIGDFIGKSGQISSFSAISGAGIGFVLHKFIDIHIYWMMICLVLLSGIIVTLFFTSTNTSMHEAPRGVLEIIKDSVEEINNNKHLKYILILFVLFQMFLQVHYQLWQSLFIDFGISSNWFIVVYFVFQAITIAAYKVPVIKVFESTSIPVGIIAILSSVFMYFIDIPEIKMVLYLIPVFGVSIFAYFTEVKFNEFVKIGNISSITSLLSTVMRIVGFIVLIFASRFILVFSLKSLFLFASIISIGSICIVIDRHIILKSNEETTSEDQLQSSSFND